MVATRAHSSSPPGLPVGVCLALSLACGTDDAGDTAGTGAHATVGAATSSTTSGGVHATTGSDELSTSGLASDSTTSSSGSTAADTSTGSNHDSEGENTGSEGSETEGDDPPPIPWGTFDGNSARNGLALAHLPRQLETLWSQTNFTMGADAYPFVDGSQVYFVGFPPGTESPKAPLDQLIALDLETGTTNWTATVPFLPNLWTGRSLDGIIQIAGVNHQHVFATRGRDQWMTPIYAYDRATGTLAWRSPQLSLASGWRGMVLLPKGDVIACDQHAVLRFAGETGTVVWRVPRPISVATGCSLSKNGLYFIERDLTESSTEAWRVQLLDPQTGQGRYASPQFSDIDSMGHLAVSDDGQFVFQLRRAASGPREDYVIAYHDNGTSLTELWRHAAAKKYSSSLAVGVDQTLYVIDDEGRLLALDGRTGEVQAASGILPSLRGGSLSPTIVVGPGGTVLLTDGKRAESTTGGHLLGLHGDLQTITINRPFYGTYRSGPAIGAKGTVLVTDTKGVHALAAPQSIPIERPSRSRSVDSIPAPSRMPRKDRPLGRVHETRAHLELGARTAPDLSAYGFQRRPLPRSAVDTVAVADWNADGLDDLFMVTDTEGSLRLNRGDGIFETHQVLMVPDGGQAFAGDFDGNGTLDVAIRSTTLLQNETGHFEHAPDAEPHASGGSQGVVVQANDDGRHDLVFNRGGAPAQISLTHESGQFFPGPTVLAPSCYTAAIAADQLNGDNIDEIVLSGSCNNAPASLPLVVYSSVHGLLQQTQFFSFPKAQIAEPSQIRLLDLDGDHSLDIVTQVGDGWAWLKNLGDGQFSEELTVSTTEDPLWIDAWQPLQVEDELVLVANGQNADRRHIQTLWRGRGTWQNFSGTEIDIEGKPHATGQFDSDRTPDLLVIAAGGDRIDLWLSARR